tara:strand:- start:933 stop:1775 length:843 start_codon:yes stop_codon:yes gene_type:complete
MPTFNQANFIGNSISSVLCQTEKDFELIIINNYSSDNTSEVVKSFSDKRIRFFNFKNNGIIAAARNFGIKKSRGKFIAFLDSDDIWYPKKLEVCNKYIKKGYNFISHNVCFKEKFKKDSKIRYKNEFNLNTLLFKGNFIATSSVIIKKTLLNSVNCFSTKKEIINSEDFDLWLRILSYEGGFMVPQVLGENTMHEFNASKDIDKSFNSAKNVLNIFFENDLIKWRKSLSFLYYSFAMLYFKTKKDRMAILYFKNSLKYNQYFIRCYLLILLTVIRNFLKV